MKFLTLLLFPFSVLYDVATRFRNHLYNVGYKRSFEFETNVIAVGNLSVGGTGKSPMIEYLIRLLHNKYQVATLSRGYGRKTRGFILAGDTDNANTIGDEPFQFYRKFKDNIKVAVGEERALAIPFLLVEDEGVEVILLDDAYQHRSVKPGLNILLTDYNRPFYEDMILPAGRLRESRKGAGRADVIVVTKCPMDLSDVEMDRIKVRLKDTNEMASVFFAGIRYSEPLPVSGNGKMGEELYLFTGVANPGNLRQYLSDNYRLVGEKVFADHHRYSEKDIQDILKSAGEVSTGDEVSLVTTEKDMVKLLSKELNNLLQGHSVFYIPIETCFLKDGRQFDELVLKSIKSYSN